MKKSNSPVLKRSWARSWPTLALLLVSVVVHAQQALPASNLWLLPSPPVAGRLAERPVLLSAFNPKGYNNQPMFFGPDRIYLTVQTASDTSQTDIVELRLRTREWVQVTATPRSSEYSPTPHPDGARFSAVRVEADNRQRLWLFPIDRSNAGTPALPDQDRVGYHAWLDEYSLALFVVGDDPQSHWLAHADLRGGPLRRIAGNPGRCLRRMADGRLAYVQKATAQTWFLKVWDPTVNLHEILVAMPQGSEDFDILPDGAFVCARQGMLFRFQRERDSDWKLYADLAPYGIRNISRIAVGPGGALAFVAAP
ncbi:MAG: hypothetical protein ACK4NS_08130 [Saprospiraceae bacterium]